MLLWKPCQAFANPGSPRLGHAVHLEGPYSHEGSHLSVKSTAVGRAKNKGKKGSALSSYKLRFNKVYKMEILIWIKAGFLKKLSEFMFFFKFWAGCIYCLFFFGLQGKKKWKIWCFVSVTRSSKPAFCTSCCAALTHQMTQTKICWRWDVFLVPSLKVDEPKRSN